MSEQATIKEELLEERKKHKSAEPKAEGKEENAYRSF